MSTQCKKCSATNRDIAKYCKYCGTKISVSSFKLEDLVGLDNVKQEIQKIINIAQAMEKKKKSGQSVPKINLHSILMGNTGTGKSKIGEILCRVFYKYGITTKDDAVMVDAVDYSKFAKDFEKNFQKAKGGILFIDNVQKLVPAGYSSELNPLDKLFVEMGKSGYDPIVILAGLPQGLKEYIDENPSIKRWFKYIFELPDFDAEQMYQIATNELKKQNFDLNKESKKRLKKLFKHLVKTKDDSFSNSHLVMKQVEDIISNYYLRILKGAPDDNIINPEDIKGYIPEEKTVEEILKELDSFVGMQNVKTTVRELINQIKMQQERAHRGIAQEEKIGMHFIITGNPGTGKTTVARKLGEIFQAIGFLDRGHVVEVDKSKMVGQYVGETPKIVKKLCDDAIGGILFIDEAYALAPDAEGSSNQYGKEAIETLMKRMEDDRDKFVVIAAGYKDEMDRFLRVNPGIPSRFDKSIYFDDYKPDELLEIFKLMTAKKKYKISAEAEKKLKIVFKDMYEKRDNNFGNGRVVRQLFENSVNRLSTRITMLLKKNDDIDTDTMVIILPDDIEYEMPKVVTLEEVMGELKSLIGMENIKTEISDLIDTINIQKERAKAIGETYKLGIHIVMTGNPGTGKTTVSRILGKVFKSIGLLTKGNVVEVDRKDLVGQYVGSTPKKTNAKIEEAMGGILFIDEAYTLAPEGVNDSYGKESIETLLTRMENERGKFIVIVAGYPKEMENFINSNPGLKSRFNRYFNLGDYKPDELLAIFKIMAKSKKYELEDKTEVKLKDIFTTMYSRRDKNFANGREVRNLFEKCIALQSKRLSSQGTYEPEELSLIRVEDIPKIYEVEKAITVEDTLKKLDSLIGLDVVKKEIRSLINYLKVEKARAAKGGKETTLTLHFVFRGNPGTGKTTVARILADVFKAMGLLYKGHLVEVDRSGLVAQYVGQTATKTNKVIDSSIGGLLFIDEAYALSPKGIGTDFGKEAIDTLLKRMEDERGKFIVIAAGYHEPMGDFINANPGLASRFTKYIDFVDYTAQEMKEIFKSMSKSKGMTLFDDTESILDSMFLKIYQERGENFANGRTVRNIFEMVLQNQSSRVADLMEKGELKPEILNTITADDFKALNL